MAQIKKEFSSQGRDELVFNEKHELDLVKGNSDIFNNYKNLSV